MTTPSFSPPGGSASGSASGCAQAAHDQSLFDLDAKYADVVELDECLDYLASLAAGR